MRSADIVQAFPTYILIIALVFVVGPGVVTILIAFTILSWVSYTRLIRTEVIRVRGLDYIAAARVGGIPRWRILTRHIVPNSIGQTLTYLPSDIVLAKLGLASLSFLGLGIPKPAPEWGAMIAAGQPYLEQMWWLSTIPGLMVALFGLGLSLIADGIQEGRGLTFHPKAGTSVPAHTARGRGIAMVFQEPMTALNPTMRVGDLVAAGVRQRTGMGRAAAQRQAVELLDAVGIPHPQRRARSWPHELSGGLRQRVVMAAALATDPELLLCDEPTTALDVTVQDQILQLIEGLRRDLGLSVLFVSHDLAVVARLCDRVLVMYAGQVVESGPAATVLGNPGHPYTRALLAAAPSLGRPAGPLVGIGGQPPDARAMPAGCRFAPRCAFAEPTCSATLPILEGPPLHQIACLRVDAVAGAR